MLRAKIIGIERQGPFVIRRASHIAALSIREWGRLSRGTAEQEKHDVIRIRCERVIERVSKSQLAFHSGSIGHCFKLKGTNVDSALFTVGNRAGHALGLI